MRIDEIDSLIGFLEGFIEAVITNKDSPHLEDTVALNNRRLELRKYLAEILHAN